MKFSSRILEMIPACSRVGRFLGLLQALESAIGLHTVRFWAEWREDGAACESSLAFNLAFLLPVAKHFSLSFEVHVILQ